MSPKTTCCQKYDEYGGIISVKGTKTGFFHVEKIDGRWWFITPCGNGFISKGITTVAIGPILDNCTKRIDTGSNPSTVTGNFTSKCPFTEGMLKKYGSVQNATKNLVEIVKKDCGLNSTNIRELSPLTTSPVSKTKLPFYYGGQWTGGNGVGFLTSWLDIFSATYTDTFVANLLANYVEQRDNPWYIGTVICSSMQIGRTEGMRLANLFEVFLDSTFTSGRPVMQNIISVKYGGSIAALNAVWKTSIASFASISLTNPSVINNSSTANASAKRISNFASTNNLLGQAITYLIVKDFFTYPNMDDTQMLNECLPRFANNGTPGQGTIAAWNAIYKTTGTLLPIIPGNGVGTGYSSFADILTQYHTPIVPGSAFELLLNDLQDIERQAQTVIATQFYTKTTGILKKFLPNHMIMGIKSDLPFTPRCTFQPEIFSPTVLQNIDVITLSQIFNLTGTEITGNPLDNDLTFQLTPMPPQLSYTLAQLAETADIIHNYSGKPILNSEFNFRTNDSGYTNTTAIKATVNTQQQKADAIYKQAFNSINTKYGIGYHWYGLFDNIRVFPNNITSNNGIFKYNSDPWPEVQKSFKKIGRDAESIHLSS
jgi:hypothetical protein